MFSDEHYNGDVPYLGGNTNITIEQMTGVIGPNGFHIIAGLEGATTQTMNAEPDRSLRSLSSGAVSSGQTQTSIAQMGSRCIMTLAEEAKP